MTTAPSADWDALRRSVRNLENELDQRISAYSKHANQLSTGYYASSSSSKATDAQMASSSEEGRQLESEINDMLEKVGHGGRGMLDPSRVGGRVGPPPRGQP